MRRIDLTRCLGMALVFWGVLAAAGCQQVPMNHGSPANKSANDSSPAQANLTAAQQADMQIAMGRVSENQGDLAGAMNIYREALKRNQNSAEAHARMAVIHDKQGEFRESAELYRKALKLSPGNPDIYCDMGYSLYLQRRWAEAEMNLRQAIALNANFARAHNNLAMLLARDTRVEAALNEFQKGGSDQASAHANVAFVLTTENRWDEAKEYQLALAANPSSKELKDRLDQLNALVAKLEPRRHDRSVTRDENLVATSASIVQPSTQQTVAGAASALQPRDSTTPTSIPRPRAIYPLDLTARERGGLPETGTVGNVLPSTVADDSRRGQSSETSDRSSDQTRCHIPPPRRVADAPSAVPVALNRPGA